MFTSYIEREDISFNLPYFNDANHEIKHEVNNMMNEAFWISRKFKNKLYNLSRSVISDFNGN